MKIPAEFGPKSWEMPPSARVIEESASVVARDFDGETLDWLVALVEIPAHEHPIVWIRPLDARFDAGFVVLGIHYKTPFVITRRHPLNAPDTLLFAMCQHHRLGRLLFFNKEGNLRQDGEASLGGVVFSPKGMASWLVDTIADDENIPVPFRWNKVLTMEKFFRLSALEIWNRLQELLCRPNHKALFARQFAFADEKTRQDLVFEVVPVEQKEFNNLLRSLIYSQDFWEEWRGQEVEIEFFVPSGQMPGVDIYLDDETMETPTELKEEVHSLWRYFQTVKTALAKHPSIVNWLHQRNNENNDAIFSPPTAHEQLEAQLRWREWKANHESEKL